MFHTKTGESPSGFRTNFLGLKML
ncbi:hypothetical protein [Dyadobacter sp. CY312]|nr:hypothetical protein [Dyadobacter sp. CY312]